MLLLEPHKEQFLFLGLLIKATSASVCTRGEAEEFILSPCHRSPSSASDSM